MPSFSDAAKNAPSNDKILLYDKNGNLAEEPRTEDSQKEKPSGETKGLGHFNQEDLERLQAQNRQAFFNVSDYFRPGHMAYGYTTKICDVCNDPDLGPLEKFEALKTDLMALLETNSSLQDFRGNIGAARQKLWPGKTSVKEIGIVGNNLSAGAGGTEEEIASTKFFKEYNGALAKAIDSLDKLYNDLVTEGYTNPCSISPKKILMQQLAVATKHIQESSGSIEGYTPAQIFGVSANALALSLSSMFEPNALPSNADPDRSQDFGVRKDLHSLAFKLAADQTLISMEEVTSPSAKSELSRLTLLVLDQLQDPYQPIPQLDDPQAAANEMQLIWLESSRVHAEGMNIFASFFDRVVKDGARLGGAVLNINRIMKRERAAGDSFQGRTLPDDVEAYIRSASAIDFGGKEPMRRTKHTLIAFQLIACFGKEFFEEGFTIEKEMAKPYADINPMFLDRFLPEIEMFKAARTDADRTVKLYNNELPFIERQKQLYQRVDISKENEPENLDHVVFMDIFSPIVTGAGSEFSELAGILVAIKRRMHGLVPTGHLSSALQEKVESLVSKDTTSEEYLRIITEEKFAYRDQEDDDKSASVARTLFGPDSLRPFINLRELQDASKFWKNPNSPGSSPEVDDLDPRAIIGKINQLFKHSPYFNQVVEGEKITGIKNFQGELSKVFEELVRNSQDNGGNYKAENVLLALYFALEASVNEHHEYETYSKMFSEPLAVASNLSRNPTVTAVYSSASDPDGPVPAVDRSPDLSSDNYQTPVKVEIGGELVEMRGTLTDLGVNLSDKSILGGPYYEGFLTKLYDRLSSYSAESASKGKGFASIARATEYYENFNQSKNGDSHLSVLAGLVTSISALSDNPDDTRDRVSAAVEAAVSDASLASQGDPTLLATVETTKKFLLSVIEDSPADTFDSIRKAKDNENNFALEIYDTERFVQNRGYRGLVRAAQGGKVIEHLAEGRKFLQGERVKVDEKDESGSSPNESEEVSDSTVEKVEQSEEASEAPTDQASIDHKFGGFSRLFVYDMLDKSYCEERKLALLADHLDALEADTDEAHDQEPSGSTVNLDRRLSLIGESTLPGMTSEDMMILAKSGDLASQPDELAALLNDLRMVSESSTKQSSSHKTAEDVATKRMAKIPTAGAIQTELAQFNSGMATFIERPGLRGTLIDLIKGKRRGQFYKNPNVETIQNNKPDGQPDTLALQDGKSLNDKTQHSPEVQQTGGDESKSDSTNHLVEMNASQRTVVAFAALSELRGLRISHKNMSEYRDQPRASKSLGTSAYNRILHGSTYDLKTEMDDAGYSKWLYPLYRKHF